MIILNILNMSTNSAIYINQSFTLAHCTNRKSFNLDTIDDCIIFYQMIKKDYHLISNEYNKSI